ncbi:bifunctional NAD(P)/FAD-dependent oxidoreductase/class I SAM-dependent methyltransferase [Mucilaginibacter sp.]|uniref:bifunctional NAD(P)/FAD-dependent oxidoreductase/class I SAM-dependent methyltransferase n=1 Tax=Mucilaginibacter sp. TaxID=1882438 RepID=UPI0025CF5A92|nr:bifunctional NAD(P)/FAD-dependent oxidoreductase/class I SAM-dependent methyltransferase [Mucilaginibacter sp.]
MTDRKKFDVIIIGGSYSGLAAAMALGRALRQVLIIDSGEPCNKQTPHSHNFLTQDGKTPKEIAALARQQVEKYNTVKFFSGLATNGVKTESGFEIRVASGEIFSAKKLIFATGIRDTMAEIDGFAACWGISVLHCPYCHGYEVRNEKTGILGNGEYGFEFSKLISNWTTDLTLFTNGKSTLTSEQTAILEKHHIKITEKEIERLEHTDGHLQNIIFKDGTTSSIKAVYAHSPFEQHCQIPSALGCEFTDEGYIRTDPFQSTTIAGVFACGDNTTKIRTVANAVAMGTTAGIMASKEIISEKFEQADMNQSWDEQYRNMWDDRYKEDGYAYGTSPNVFFKEWIQKFEPGSILMPADGEGRNGVFAAQLGWEVTSFDLSVEGKLKALELAKEADVTIDYIVGDLEQLEFEKESFDAIALIYAHFAAAKKSSFHQKLNTYLKPGGVVILEAFSKEHIHLNNGGPTDIDMLFSVEEIRADFANYDLLILEEKEILFDEGMYHVGNGSVVRFVGKKNLVNAY